MHKKNKNNNNYYYNNNNNEYKKNNTRFSAQTHSPTSIFTVKCILYKEQFFNWPIWGHEHFHTHAIVNAHQYFMDFMININNWLDTSIPSVLQSEHIEYNINPFECCAQFPFSTDCPLNYLLKHKPKWIIFDCQSSEIRNFVVVVLFLD